MSKIRFIHSDHLRLGTPLAGLADAPGWLQQLGTDCVRQAVRNVIEATLAHQADFLLIAGRISESSDDFDSTLKWLGQQLGVLSSRGVQVVGHAQDAQTAAMLKSVFDVVLGPGEVLNVHANQATGCRLSKSQLANSSESDLVVSVGDHQHTQTGRLVYGAIPNLHSSNDCSRVEVGHLVQSAGSVQAVSPSETCEFGCLLIEADSDARELKSEFLPTDVIRYANEELSFSSSKTVDAVLDEISQVSADIGRSQTQTILVDWIVNADLVSELTNVSGLVESVLLDRLRAKLESGHRGVWPRRIEFVEPSTLQLTSNGSEAVQEYVEVVCGSVDSFDVDRFTDRRLVFRGDVGVDVSLIEGLRLLSRVA